jgi:hypothetical protein
VTFSTSTSPPVVASLLEKMPQLKPRTEPLRMVRFPSVKETMPRAVFALLEGAVLVRLCPPRSRITLGAAMMIASPVAGAKVSSAFTM